MYYLYIQICVIIFLFIVINKKKHRLKLIAGFLKIYERNENV